MGIEAITSRVQGSEKTLTNDTAMAAAAEEAVCDDGKGIVAAGFTMSASNENKQASQ